MRPKSMLYRFYLTASTGEDRVKVRELFDKKNYGAAEAVAVRRLIKKYAPYLDMTCP